MTTTYVEKIMNFDVANGFDAFINMFDENEIAEMNSWLVREFDYDYSWASEKEAKEMIVMDYVKEWLCDNVRNLTLNGTEQLFKILYQM